jgi:hypothetical protein
VSFVNVEKIYPTYKEELEKRRRNILLILKHVEYEITEVAELEGLLAHLRKTTSQVEGVTFQGVYFVKNKKEFVLFLQCETEEKYLEWREICPPPPGAKDWYEVLLTQEECFP